MPTLVKRLYPVKLTKLNKQSYACHQEVLRKMVARLAKMEYSSVKSRLEFFKQYELIMGILWSKVEGYSSVDKYLYTTYNLIKFLDPGSTVCTNPRVKLIIYNFDSPKKAYIFNNQQFVLSQLSKCTSDVIAIPLELQGADTSHANLIILNKYSKLAWRIEPNAGTTFDVFNETIDFYLTGYLSSIGYRYLYEFPGECPLWLSKIPSYITKYLPLPRSEPMEYISHDGLCMMLSVGKFIYGNKLTNEILKDFIVRFLKSEIKKHCS